MNLFPSDQVVGIFRGFQQGGMEFHADLVLPYRSDFQNTPMHGQFVLVQLETPDEAVLGRIASFSSEGKLAFGSGEEFNLRAMRENRPVPEDLREDYLKYRVNIRVLGVVRNGNDRVAFVPSHRRLPHVGSKVAFPSAEVLREIAGHNVDGALIGHLAYGEYIYAGDDGNLETEDWMQVLHPEVQVRFPVESLVSRRSFIFARAGFGKSNLNKLLFAKLYETTPTVEKRNGQKVPVGTVLFDPEGEYFWPDDKGRPGLCDVPELEDKIVLFTTRRSRSQFYQSFVAGGIKLDIRRLRPADVIAIALDPERQEQQNVRKLRGLSQDRWERLVNAIEVNGHATPLSDVADLLDLELPRQEAEATAARANITVVVKMLHDKSSQMMDKLMRSLSEGKLCIIDVSQMRGGQSLILSGIILRRIFDRNQEQFTEANPRTIPTIAVVEEAQSVLGDRDGASEPYVSWIKEGRKYDLGALLVTQQPGSIPVEILSQGDNWFVIHLLSSADLVTLKRANSHFSDDLLSSLLNEPIPGQGLFWSSVGGKPYPISLRAESFESMYHQCDPDLTLRPGDTFARELEGMLGGLTAEKGLEKAPASVQGETDTGVAPPEDSASLRDEANQEEDLDGTIDVMGVIEQRAIQALQADMEIMGKVSSAHGMAWGSLKAFLLEQLPEHLDDRDGAAYRLVAKALNEIFGPQDTAWESYRYQRGDRHITYVRLLG